MNATSTHDSKRGEDVRARLNVLSEIPDRWRQAVTRWARMNERHKQRCGDVLAPDRNDEYLLYQTLVGALPFEESEYDSFTQRIKDYMIKAVREAKTYSDWVAAQRALRRRVSAIRRPDPGPLAGEPLLGRLPAFPKGSQRRTASTIPCPKPR